MNPLEKKATIKIEIETTKNDCYAIAHDLQRGLMDGWHLEMKVEFEEKQKSQNRIELNDTVSVLREGWQGTGRVFSVHTSKTDRGSEILYDVVLEKKSPTANDTEIYNLDESELNLLPF